MNFSGYQQNLTIYITSIEEHEEYYVKMYDFYLILHKENPKCNEIIKLIEVNKVYVFSINFHNEEYIIIDVKEINYTEFYTVINSVTNDINMDTIVKTGSLLPINVILKRENDAYCSIYNKLKLNIPCCLILYNNCLMGISEVKIFSEQITVGGLINIDIEFDDLHNYQEVIAIDPEFKRRMVFPKSSFKFKIGHNYEVKYEKITEDFLYKIIESNEI